MTTKREEWTWDGFGGLLVNGRKVAQLEPGESKVGARIAAVPDMEAALMLQGYTKDGEWHTRHCRDRGSAKRCVVTCADARAALRKAGRIP